ncbi:MAG: DUF1178 family protein [Roseinatronobacter sp.]|nr:DUF1178 family protein [Roseinatronobacter sp.]
MIKYSLRCAEGHGFESWFQSGAAFDGLLARKLVSCPHCGTSAVEKALMAPAVGTGSAAPAPQPPASPPDEAVRRLQALRTEIEANSDYVGDRFAAEARAMYLGETPDRPIYGEAQPAEARALLDEGVPVLPLPFLPSRKAN